MKFQAATIVAASIFAATPALSFELSSPDIHEGAKLGHAQISSVFGCSGDNVSPALNWKDAPAGTKSFVVSLYDPDAPTGSGWWHWVVYDIPSSATSLPAGAGNQASNSLPPGAIQGHNDAGQPAFMGACPPPGPAHRYVFTVTALKLDKLGVQAGASGAMIGYMTKANALASASITATLGQ